MENPPAENSKEAPAPAQAPQQTEVSQQNEASQQSQQAQTPPPTQPSQPVQAPPQDQNNQAAQTNQPDPNTTAPQNPPPKKKHTVLKVILILFVLIIGAIFAGGWYLLHEVNIKLAEKGINKQIQVKDLNNIYNNIKNTKSYPGVVVKGEDNPNAKNSKWNTYQNTGYKFSIDFPGDLQEKENAPGFGVSQIDIYDPTDSQNGVVYQLLVFPKSMGKLIGQDFDEFYGMKNNTSKIISVPQGASQNLTKISNRTVSGLRAFDFQSTTNPPQVNEEPQIGTYIEAGTSIIIIVGSSSDKTEFEQMVQSFKYPI